MLKHLLILISLVFTSTIAISQQNCSVISYKQIYTMSKTVESDWKLYVTNTSSLYLETNIQKTKSRITINRNEIGTTRMHKPGRKNIAPNFYLNNNKEFYFRQNYFDEILLVKENYQDINHSWEIVKETKIIGNIQCTKATTTFRGRNYTAWYADEIPLPYGPWKFSGLPGLILEVYDDKKEVHFVANKVQINKLDNCDDSINAIKLENPINIVEYQHRIDEILDEFFKRISARQTAGRKPIKRDKNCTDCSKLEYFD